MDAVESHGTLRSPLILTEKGYETIATIACPGILSSRALHFVIDTGSTLSFLGHKDAIQAGLDFDSLPTYGKPVAGFGGSADARHIRGIVFIYLDFGGQLHEVELEEGILVYRPAKTKTKEWKLEGSVSLLGRDFLSRAQCRLVVDSPRGQAYFEK